MGTKSVIGRFARLVMVPVLAAAVGAGVAQAQPPDEIPGTTTTTTTATMGTTGTTGTTETMAITMIFTSAIRTAGISQLTIAATSAAGKGVRRRAPTSYAASGFRTTIASRSSPSRTTPAYPRHHRDISTATMTAMSSPIAQPRELSPTCSTWSPQRPCANEFLK